MRRGLTHVVLVLSLAWISSSCGGGDGGPGPGPEPPVIVSGPRASGITVSSATITWTTDKTCDSKVTYGRTSAYTDSITAGQLVLSHSITLSGLDFLTTYHYMVSSQDADGLIVTSGDRTFSTMSPVPDLIDQGWDFFEEGELDSALARFDNALLYEPGSASALEGLGWAYLYLYMFDQSFAALEEAISAEPGRLDCLVALAFLYESTEAYEDAIDAAGQALDIGGESYVFDHDTDITTSDVRYSLIISLAATGDLTGALNEAKILDPSIDLDPDDATTWDGHSSFEEALLILIENLKSQV